MGKKRITVEFCTDEDVALIEKLMGYFDETHTRVDAVRTAIRFYLRYSPAVKFKESLKE